jgi:hypothetical protein
MSRGETSRGEMSYGEKCRMGRNVAGRNVAGRNVAGRNVFRGEMSHSPKNEQKWRKNQCCELNYACDTLTNDVLCEICQLYQN